MLKKMKLMVAVLLMSSGLCWAQVDVNTADQVALDGIKGIGPKTSRVILDERQSGGKFKDWDDFEKRVKGIGPASARRLSESGLTVNGKSKAGAAVAKKAADKPTKATKATTVAKADQGKSPPKGGLK